ncbi:hypothetical protein SSAG_04940 [Streptomyces sp. Mg1]|nr:hypothetical protein SSAG_04940 [Streptomyces sp. Mg1]
MHFAKSGSDRHPRQASAPVRDRHSPQHLAARRSAVKAVLEAPEPAPGNPRHLQQVGLAERVRGPGRWSPHLHMGSIRDNPAASRRPGTPYLAAPAARNAPEEAAW